MSNDLTSVQNLGSALAASATRLQSTDGDGDPFLKLAKSGDWIYGADEIEVQEKSQWLVNPNTISEGFVNWGDGELLGEEMALMTGDAIVSHTLPIIAGSKRGWEKQLGIQLYCMTGEDKGTQVLYKTASKGGIKAVRALITAIVSQINSDPSNISPVITLDVDSYKHKQYGKIYTPELNLVSFVSGMPSDASAGATSTDIQTDVVGAVGFMEEDTEEETAAPSKRRRRPVAS
jgi:hypothetical protein